MPKVLRREKGGDFSEDHVTISFVCTDQMAERLRGVLYQDRYITRGDLLREAVHRYLLWREENHSEARKYAAHEGRSIKETQFEYPKVKSMHPNPVTAERLDRGDFDTEERLKLEQEGREQREKDGTNGLGDLLGWKK